MRKIEDYMILAGKQFSLLNQVHKRIINNLADVEFKVFSQWGEDGVIDWLIEKLSPLPENFIEFGVQDYKEANTRFLLINRNWRGLVLDASKASIASICSDEIYWQRDLTARSVFITRENISEIINEAGFDSNIGLLSVDIDGNDYWVWEAIDSINPVIVVCEFNSVLGDVHPISIPYIKNFERFSINYSGQYFGASIKSLLYLGKKKGYTFVGTPSTGVNAFFVRDDYMHKLTDCLNSYTVYPSRHSDTRDKKNNLSFLRGFERFNLISHLPVINVESGQEILLKDLSCVYSESWLNRAKGLY